VCIDELPKQLVSETRVPIPPRPGCPARHDYEYKREGVANLFIISQPLLGWRHVEITDRRTGKDFAEVLRWLAEDLHPEAERIVLVTDNLNTHGPGCLYEALAPARARRIARRLEWHYTPKHGSWLNVAECEFAALSKQCLNQRISSLERLRRVVGAWEEDRNERMVGVNWRFASADARIKLRRLYPSDPDGADREKGGPTDEAERERGGVGAAEAAGGRAHGPRGAPIHRRPSSRGSPEDPRPLDMLGPASRRAGGQAGGRPRPAPVR
jgi:transposase